MENNPLDKKKALMAKWEQDNPNMAAEKKEETSEDAQDVLDFQPDVAEQAVFEDAVKQETSVEVTEEDAVEKYVPTEQDEEIAALKSQIAGYELTLKTTIKEKTAQLPDSMAQLVPQDIPLTEQLDWISKAQAAVSELKPANDVPEQIVQIGRPTPVTSKIVDGSDLPVGQRISNALADHWRV